MPNASTDWVPHPRLSASYSAMPYPIGIGASNDPRPSRIANTPGALCWSGQEGGRHGGTAVRSPGAHRVGGRLRHRRPRACQRDRHPGRACVAGAGPGRRRGTAGAGPVGRAELGRARPGPGNVVAWAALGARRDRRCRGGVRGGRGRPADPERVPRFQLSLRLGTRRADRFRADPGGHRAVRGSGFPRRAVGPAPAAAWHVGGHHRFVRAVRLVACAAVARPGRE